MSAVSATVSTFDERRGDGTATDDDGESYYFHCVDIADGTRFIAPGTRIVATRTPGRLGRDELTEIYSLEA